MAHLLKPIQFIKGEEKLAGNGKDDPFRRIEQYFTVDGVLVLEYDHHLDKITMTTNMLEELRKLSATTKSQYIKHNTVEQLVTN